ncbi:MAG: hypothetical protein U9R16_07430, partial [Campylobacterota bacterium]|nr:hypothetical protein [Campylobacterota bacterium]
MNKVRIIFSLSVLFILINVTIFSIVKINEQQRIGSALDTHLDRLEAHFKMLMYHQSLTADAAYKSTVNKKVVIDILSEASGDSTKERKAVLRKKLQKILDAKYKILKAKGVLQYHFVLPNNKVFLRMHKPSKFGDSLADIRFSFKYTNSTHKKVSGFEQGKTSHGFRNVYPIFDENKNLISSIEISFSSDEIQEHLTTIGKIHTHFLVYKHILDEKAWIREDIVNKYIISAENPEYLITMTKNHLKKTCVDENKKRLEPILSQIDEKIFRGEKFALYSKYNDKVFVVSFYPIKNIKDKKTVAWIVSYENDDFINMTLKSNLYIEIISFLILIVLFYFIYRVFNQKIEIDIELKEKSKIL